MPASLNNGSPKATKKEKKKQERFVNKADKAMKDKERQKKKRMASRGTKGATFT